LENDIGMSKTSSMITKNDIVWWRNRPHKTGLRPFYALLMQVYGINVLVSNKQYHKLGQKHACRSGIRAASAKISNVHRRQAECTFHPDKLRLPKTFADPSLTK
jgi:hypothetical protein